MADIVERLRSTCKADKDCSHAPCFGYCLPLEAADEIERLRRALLIAAGKLSATDAYAMLPPDVVHEALLTLADKEARRG